jgi:transposase-like protein
VVAGLSNYLVFSQVLGSVATQTARTCKYLNNIVEQDHRAIKRRCAAMKGFKSFTNAAITIAGIELAHRIHKRQFSFGLGRPRRNSSLKVRWQQALA